MRNNPLALFYSVRLGVAVKGADKSLTTIPPSQNIQVTDLHTKIDVLERAVEVKKMELSQLQRDHNNACAKKDSAPAPSNPVLSNPVPDEEMKRMKNKMAKSQSEVDQLRCEIKMLERKAADKENDLVKIRKVHNEVRTLFLRNQFSFFRYPYFMGNIHLLRTIPCIFSVCISNNVKKPKGWNPDYHSDYQKLTKSTPPPAWQSIIV